MGAWYVRPFKEGGWQILTPCHTQAAAVLGAEPEAIETAITMIGDEGGGELVVLTKDGEACQTHRVLPKANPYRPRAGLPDTKPVPSAAADGNSA